MNQFSVHRYITERQRLIQTKPRCQWRALHEPAVGWFGWPWRWCWTVGFSWWYLLLFFWKPCVAELFFLFSHRLGFKSGIKTGSKSGKFQIDRWIGQNLIAGVPTISNLDWLLERKCYYCRRLPVNFVIPGFWMPTALYCFYCFSECGELSRVPVLAQHQIAWGKKIEELPLARQSVRLA